MGDITEITTHARELATFYRISASALSFEVKANYSAVIGLTKEPGDKCQYWIGFGLGGRVWIKGPDGIRSTHGGSNALTNQHFKRFWISWDCGALRIGQGRDMSYILTYPNNFPGLSYVTFTTYDMRNPTKWRFEMPPASVITTAYTVPCKKISGGEPHWVEAADQLPDDAVIGGFQGETMYIIRAHHEGSLTPGKFVPSEGTAYVSWGGVANVAPEFQVLCGYNFVWKPTSADSIPVDAFVAGHSEVHNEKLYIGRVNHTNCTIPGKVQPSHKVCYVAFGDREIPFHDYEILTIPESNPYIAGEYLQTNMKMINNHGNHVLRVNNDVDDIDDEEDYDDMNDEEAYIAF